MVPGGNNGTEGGRRDVVVPAVVSADPHGGLVAGDEAARLTASNPELGVESIKRLIGRRVGTPEVEWLAAGSPQLWAQGERSIGIELGPSRYSARALAHEVLRQTVETAERAVRRPGHKRRQVPAVLTIPAVFDMAQRIALRKLTKHAGIDVRRFVEAPLAALLAMDLPADVKRVTVADFGAGYVDILVAERADRGWTMLGADGDALLGTDDLDQRLTHLFAQSFYDEHGIDVSQRGVCLGRMRRLARQIRLDAGNREPTTTMLPDFVEIDGRSLALVHPPIGVRDLENLWMEELDSLPTLCIRLYEELGFGTDDVDALVLLGGGSRIPMVRWRFEDVLRHEALPIQHGPFLAARGAAALAGADPERGPHATSVLPHVLSLRVGDRPPVAVTRRNQRLPITSTHFFVPTPPHPSPTTFLLCQGEVSDVHAPSFVDVTLERTDKRSYVVEMLVSGTGDVELHVQPSAMLGVQQGAPVHPSTMPPQSPPGARARLDSITDDSWPIVTAGPAAELPAVQSRRADSDRLEVPSSRPEKVMRRSTFTRPDSSDRLDSIPPTSMAAPPSGVGDTIVPESGGPVSSRSAGDPLVGTVLDGRYEITRVLGEGSMARVYRAKHRFLKSTYAVKVMHPELATHADMRERFLREARSAASIDNDHVVRILDFGRIADGRDYFVMEHLEGTSLEDEMGRRLLPMPLVMTTMIHVARGLAAAHEHGIVHRDLKPENIWLTEIDDIPRIKILDFGVAKISTPNRGLTMGHAIIGTPYYMAPDQIAGDSDPRTDLYAAGIVMFELVTGRLPFYHESLAFVLAMQCETPLPSPQQLAGPVRCPDELERIIARCCEKKKANRYQSAAELLTALEGLAIPRA